VTKNKKDKRQPRQTREELRSLLLETGRTILREDGLGTGAEALTFKRVFQRVEEDKGIRVTNASVIRRVWENQAEFQVDVLMAIAQGDYQEDIDTALDEMRPLFAAMDRSTPESRQRAMREMCRVGGRVNAHAHRQSNELPSWISVWALAASGKSIDYRGRIEEALLSGYEAFTKRLTDMYAIMTAYLGFRLREQFTLRHFVVAADSLAQGYSLRDRIDNVSLEHISRSTGPGAEPEDWTLFAVAFEALVQQFFEVDPEWEPEDRGGQTYRSADDRTDGESNGGG
jgi:hypothetical protein